MMPEAMVPDRSNFDMTNSVSAVAGTLPMASSVTMRHRTV